MRVVSLVPSWTETLLEAGIEVVGRTRFCIHPKNSGIPRIGGTKDWQWERIKSLKPDLILLDKEENPKFMSEQNEIPFHATHVQSVHDMPRIFTELAALFKNQKLEHWAEEWTEVLQRKPPQDIPGILEWGRKPNGEDYKCLYMIWKDPWMTIGQNTFIASMLRQVGVPLIDFTDNYPKIDLEKFPPEKTLLLFSSEPYPFFKRRQDLVSLGFPYAFIDGESFSWFGVRALRFLQLTSS
jgi:ABC-type Fe3+-hydroxamate transport system substrate-binding protein